MATLEAIAEPARPIRLPGTGMCSDVDGATGKMDVAVGLPDRSSPCQIDRIA